MAAVQLEQYVSFSIASEKLCVTKKTLKRWIDAGKLQGATKVGRDWRIPESEIFRLIEAGKPKGGN